MQSMTACQDVLKPDMPSEQILIRRWFSKSKSKVFDELPFVIHPDDTIGIVKKKIADFFDLPHAHHVHIWAKSDFVLSATLIQNVYDSVSHTHDKRQSLSHLFPGVWAHAADDFRDQDMSHADLAKLLQGSRSKYLLRPLGLRWMHEDSSDILLACNPFLSLTPNSLFTNSVGQPRQTVRLKNEHSITLAECIRLHDRFLDVILLDDVVSHVPTVDNTIPDTWKHGFLRVYFPEVPVTITDSGSTTGTDDIDGTRYAIADHCLSVISRSTDRVTWIHDTCRISYMHVRVNHNPGRYVFPLIDVFNEFRVDENIPFVLYRSEHNMFYKLHEDSIAPLIANGQLQEWLSKKRVRRLVSFVVWNIRISRTTYFTVTMFSNMQYDVHYSFDKSSMLGRVQHISDTVPKVRKIVEHVRKHVSVGTYVPHIDVDSMWNTPKFGSLTRTIAINVNTAFRDTAFHVPSTSEFVKHVPHLASILRVISQHGAKRTGVGVQYKRVSNYISQDAESRYIQEHSHHNRGVLVKRLRTLYGLTQHEAIKRIEEWQQIRARMLRMNIRESAYVTMRVICDKHINTTLRITGATSLHQVARIADAIKCVCLLSSDGRLRRQISHVKHHVPATSSTSLTSLDFDLKMSPELQNDFLMQLGLGSTDWPNDAAATSDHQAEYAGDPGGAGDADDADDEEGKDDADDEEETNDQNPSEDAALSKMDNQYLLDHLNKADPTLFVFKQKGFKSYATQCGKVDERQPISMTSADKENQDASYPNGYGEVVLYGSSPSNVRYYACPDVWCPKSKIAMTYAQFAANDNKCPMPYDTAIRFENKYWNGREKTRYIGFLNPSKHPRGLCMPCCFKKQNQHFAKCSQAATPAGAHTGRYIKNDPHTLETGRTALLPSILHSAFLNDGSCGNHKDGSGLLHEQSDCFLRMGLPDSRQSSSFLAALSHAFSTSIPRIRHIVGEALDVNLFVRLQEGAVCRAYIRNDAPPDDAAKDTPQSRRDALIQNALTRFLHDLNSKSCVRMDHWYLRDIASLCFDVNIIVLETRWDIRNDKVLETFLHCAPLNPSIDKVVIFIQTPTGNYELIVRTKLATSTSKLKLLDVTTEWFHDFTDPRLSLFAEAVRQACTSRGDDNRDAVVTMLIGLDATLRMRDRHIEHIVLDTETMFVVGLLLNDNMFLPLPVAIPPAVHFDWGWIFLDQVLCDRYDVNLRVSTVTNLLQHLRNETLDDRFSVRSTLYDTRHHAVAVMDVNGNVIPVDSKRLRATSHADWFTHNLNKITDAPPTDEDIGRALHALRTEQHLERLIPFFFYEITKDSEILSELQFLNSLYNPLPLAYRRARAVLLLHQISKKIQLDVPKRFTALFARRCATALFSGMRPVLSKPMHVRDGEIILNAEDAVRLIAIGLTRENISNLVRAHLGNTILLD